MTFICHLILCEKWLQYWAVIFPCSLYSFWKEQQFQLLEKKTIQENKAKIWYDYTGLEVHFQTFVVVWICVKLKKNVARAKELYLQFWFKKKKHFIVDCTKKIN